MEGIRSSSVLSCYYSSKTHFKLRRQPLEHCFLSLPPPPPPPRHPASRPKVRNSLPSMALQVQDQQSFHKSKEMLPKIDKSGRFCSPRAARELALLIVYASCLQGSDPIRLFEKRINAARGMYYMGYR
ncbi:hypothetical protein Goarm_010574 [Gossypium armourianum]|uniref:Uncharacterized protein n=1 Tax=Gossypium armourianum TaxID=34283 RepID=A0A7J9IWS8_9ROSI|nr:hypothetical protein [Gossypium armourianum]